MAALESYLHDTSVIVRVNALEALAAFARGNEALAKKVLNLLVEKSETGAPAEKTRARKLLKHFDQGSSRE